MSYIETKKQLTQIARDQEARRPWRHAHIIPDEVIIYIMSFLESTDIYRLYFLNDDNYGTYFRNKLILINNFSLKMKVSPFSGDLLKTIIAKQHFIFKCDVDIFDDKYDMKHYKFVQLLDIPYILDASYKHYGCIKSLTDKYGDKFIKFLKNAKYVDIGGSRNLLDNEMSFCDHENIPDDVIKYDIPYVNDDNNNVHFHKNHINPSYFIENINVMKFSICISLKLLYFKNCRNIVVPNINIEQCTIEDCTDVTIHAENIDMATVTNSKNVTFTKYINSIIIERSEPVTCQHVRTLFVSNLSFKNIKFKSVIKMNIDECKNITHICAVKDSRFRRLKMLQVNMQINPVYVSRCPELIFMDVRENKNICISRCPLLRTIYAFDCDDVILHKLKLDRVEVSSKLTTLSRITSIKFLELLQKGRIRTVKEKPKVFRIFNENLMKKSELMKCVANPKTVKYAWTDPAEDDDYYPPEWCYVGDWHMF